MVFTTHPPLSTKTLGEGEAYEGQVLAAELRLALVLVQVRRRLRLLELVEVGRVVFTRHRRDKRRGRCEEKPQFIFLGLSESHHCGG